jgi:hypothetical protein
MKKQSVKLPGYLFAAVGGIPLKWINLGLNEMTRTPRLEDCSEGKGRNIGDFVFRMECPGASYK